MKKITRRRFTQLFLLLLFFISSPYVSAQIGIGTSDPKPETLLDVTSSEKGILLPRVDIEDLTTLAPINSTSASERLLVFNTNANTGKGFYYWNGNDAWISIGGAIEAKDWFEVNSSPEACPDDINDDMYTFGKVGIGTDIPETTLHISGTTEFLVEETTHFSGTNVNLDENNEEFISDTFTAHSTSIDISFDYDFDEETYWCNQWWTGYTCNYQAEFTAVLYNETTGTETQLIYHNSDNNGTYNSTQTVNEGDTYSLHFIYDGQPGTAEIDNFVITGDGPPVLQSSPFKLVDGTQAAGKVLVSDADGYAYWETPANAISGNAGGGTDTSVTPNFFGFKDMVIPTCSSVNDGSEGSFTRTVGGTTYTVDWEVLYKEEGTSVQAADNSGNALKRPKYTS